MTMVQHSCIGLLGGVLSLQRTYLVKATVGGHRFNGIVYNVDLISGTSRHIRCHTCVEWISSDDVC